MTSKTSLVADDAPRWEVCVLFNGNEEQAEQMLKRLADIAFDLNPTAVSALLDVAKTSGSSS